MSRIDTLIKLRDAASDMEQLAIDLAAILRNEDDEVRQTARQEFSDQIARSDAAALKAQSDYTSLQGEFRELWRAHKELKEKYLELSRPREVRASEAWCSSPLSEHLRRHWRGDDD